MLNYFSNAPLGGSSRLSGQARDLLDAAMEGTSRIFIPAIVVAELMMFAEKLKVEIGKCSLVDFDKLMRQEAS